MIFYFLQKPIEISSLVYQSYFAHPYKTIMNNEINVHQNSVSLSLPYIVYGQDYFLLYNLGAGII